MNFANYELESFDLAGFLKAGQQIPEFFEFIFHLCTKQPTPITLALLEFLPNMLEHGVGVVNLRLLDDPKLLGLLIDVPEPVECVVPTSSVSRAPVRSPLRTFDRFVNCARSLWDLVREHHRKERVK